MMKVIRFLYKAMCFINLQIDHYICTLIFKLKLIFNGVKFGKCVKCYNAVPALQISRNSGKVEIGDNVIFNAYTGHSWNSKCKILVKENATLSIGDNSGMNGAMIYSSEKIVIGSNVKIGGGSRIFDTDFHSLDYLQRRNNLTDGSNAKHKPVIIGNDVFIGANCIIGKGITIGDRCIIAAGSVVVKAVPSDEVWGGNPARFLKDLRNEK